MLIVTGTKRSGTSMWMQILIAAGFPAFGEAFPRDWANTLKEANQEGFYESTLRAGIYHATNPHPKTGAYFFPEEVTWHCVKVFIPGLIRSDRAYLNRVIATVREWREYEASVLRLYSLEDKQREGAGDHDTPVRMPPALEWWTENFGLVRDISIRRYPVHVQSYGGLLRDPERVIHETIAWLGRGDAKRAAAQPKAARRTFQRPTSSSLPSELAGTFDELYATIDERKPVTTQFIVHLNATNERLLPMIREHRRKVRADIVRRKADQAARPAPAATEADTAAPAEERPAGAGER